MHVRDEVQRQFKMMVPENEHAIVIDFLRQLLNTLGQPSAQIRLEEICTYEVSGVKMTTREVDSVIDATLKRFDVHWEPPLPTLARPGLIESERAISV